MIEARLQVAEPQTSIALSGELSVVNLAFAEEDGSRVLDGISFTVSLADHIAIIGQGGSGKSELALLLARLIAPTGGRVTIGGLDFAKLPTAVIGRRFGCGGSA